MVMRGKRTDSLPLCIILECTRLHLSWARALISELRRLPELSDGFREESSPGFPSEARVGGQEIENGAAERNSSRGRMSRRGGL